jgi:hypothetical protein
MKYIIVFYNHYGYTVYLFNDGQIENDMYSAGNNKWSSADTDSVPLDNANCVPLWRIRQYAKHTGRQIAREEGVPFVGTQFDDFDINDIR